LGSNISGRGYPDVAAFAHQIPIVYAGRSTFEDGTSASAPIFAGMVTLLNDIRLSQGKPPLGFLNPLLYSLDASYFNDVTQGNSFCIPKQCVDAGYAATPGWDPVSGLGTPIFSKLADYVRNLPNNTSPTTSTSSTTSGVNTSTTSTTSTFSPTSSTPTQSPSSASRLYISVLLLLVIAFTLM